jgi:hypothetical protein
LETGFFGSVVGLPDRLDFGDAALRASRFGLAASRLGLGAGSAFFGSVALAFRLDFGGAALSASRFGLEVSRFGLAEASFSWARVSEVFGRLVVRGEVGGFGRAGFRVPPDVGGWVDGRLAAERPFRGFPVAPRPVLRPRTGAERGGWGAGCSSAPLRWGFFGGRCAFFVGWPAADEPPFFLGLFGGFTSAFSSRLLPGGVEVAAGFFRRRRDFFLGVGEVSLPSADASPV